MRTLIFRPIHNAAGRHDVTGAFQPEADSFRALHQGAIAVFDNRKLMPDRAVDVLSVIEHYAGRDLQCVAFFCHGWRSGIQAGFTLADVDRLADALCKCLIPTGIIALYACSTGIIETNYRSSVFHGKLHDLYNFFCMRFG
jgi:hypothetical protein